MAKDLMFYYTKDENIFNENELGEIQQDFNMSMVIDGTKDSMKVQVLSFSDVPLVPYTIVYHASTKTWWVVSHDKIERFEHEGSAYWLHELELVGAIELLNARDLTDCGFTDNVYTVSRFLARLFKLSNFEYRVVGLGGDLTIETNYLNKDLKVDFLKTFENYTLLSAIREFLDGYNATAKLSFTTNPFGDINGAKLVVIPKTGKSDSVFQESVFNDVRETKTMDKDSYGTTIVSNAQNVVSTKAKTYPTVGGVRLSSTEYEIKPENACIRLPSPVYKVNWVKGVVSSSLRIHYLIPNMGYDNIFANYDATNTDSIITALEDLAQQMETIENDYFSGDRTRSDLIRSFESNQEYINKIISNSFITFWADDYIYDLNNATTGTLSDDPVGLFVSKQNHQLYRFLSSGGSYKYYICGKESLRNGVLENWHVMYYDTGSNLIKGFDFFKEHSFTSGTNPTIRPDLTIDNVIYNNTTLQMELNSNAGSTYIQMSFKSTKWQVNYIPMSDVKIKLDNDGTNNDTQYYNQTGKLTDSNALSKLLLSYSKEIESTTITKYGTYYDFDTMPSVGSIVLINEKPYVINNISYNFQENENNSYIIFAEFTLSQYVSTKSLMVNPNTSIRDYAIPQNFNVKRKQIYRDYWELSYTSGGDNNVYLPIVKTLNIGNYYQDYVSHTALIKTTYEDENSDYYQLESSVFVFKKSIYEVIDFNDNNIIGYSCFNSTTGFDVTKLLDNNVVVNTPISYVDKNGRVDRFDIKFLNKEQLTDSWAATLFTTVNNFVYIPESVYVYSTGDFQITEEYYSKDATEVPVFEYCSQFGNSDDCEIGDNIFDCLSTDIQYFYVFDAVNKGSINNDNFSSLEDRSIFRTTNYDGTFNECVGGCMMKWVSGKLRIYFLESFQIEVGTNKVRFATYSNIPSALSQKDYVIRRLTLTPDSELSGISFTNVKNDLLFVIKNTQNATVGTQTISDDFGRTDTCWYIELIPNHYKLN